MKLFCSLTVSLLFLIVFFIPVSVSAATIFISEIMYDLEGSDSKREWIEISNTSGGSVDLNGYRLFENGTNHKLNVIQENSILTAGESAIVSDNTETFLSDNPSYNGMLFDSSFSLSNSGETLILRDENLTDIDSVSYLSDWGAAGDGNSLQLISDSWIAESPTPGNIPSSASESAQGSEIEDTSTNKNTTGGTFSSLPRPTLFADAGSDRIVTSGADSLFSGRGFTDKGVELEKIKFLWNFGNGNVSREKTVQYHYDYPGTYRVMLTIASGRDIASDKIIVTALPAEVSVTKATAAYTEIANHASRELDISGWFLFDGTQYFRFPEGTAVLPNTSVRITAGVSKITGGNVALLYPNGKTVEQLQPTATPASSTLATVFTQSVSTSQGNQNSSTGEKAPIVKEESKNDLPVSVAAASAAKENSSFNNIFLWILAVLGVVGVGIFGFLVSRDSERGGFLTGKNVPGSVSSEADEYTIIEEKD